MTTKEKTKRIMENAFSKAERVLFEKYFSGLSLKEIMTLYRLPSCDLFFDDMPNISGQAGRPSQRVYRTILADAIFKFYILTILSPELSVEKLNQNLLNLKLCIGLKIKYQSQQKNWYKEIYSVNTLKHNIFSVIKSKRMGHTIFKNVHYIMTTE